MKSDSFQRARNTLSAAREGLLQIEAIKEEVWQSAFTVLEERIGKLILTGVGKSGYVAMKIAATLTSLGHTAVFVHPVEALHGDMGVIKNGDAVIALSFSGNTKELAQFLTHAKDAFTLTIVALVGNQDSRIARLADCVVPILISNEGCPLDLAPMASTTAMLVVGDALSAGLTSPEQFTKSDFARFHPSGTLGLTLTPVGEKMVRNVPIVVKAETPLEEVLMQMNQVGKGLLGVVGSSGMLIGGVTDGDIRRLLTKTLDARGAYARDVMSVNPKSVKETHSLKEALHLMETHKITNLFVTDESGSPIGIIHMHDIVHHHEAGY
jgi:arabinose-5-phosphate isomerase